MEILKFIDQIIFGSGVIIVIIITVLRKLIINFLDKKPLEFQTEINKISYEH